MSRDEDPRIGTLLDSRYRVLERLGRGGAGVVYRARHEDMEREVAIKVLHDDLVISGGAAIERFRREARSAGALSHPNVVTVHDFRRGEGGEAFLVMEYCEGGSLADRVARMGRRPLSEVARYLEEAASAIDAAHAAGIVHRDLKPANLLLSRERIRVADFGLAKVFSGDDPQLTGWRAIGSPLYMSPEQCQGMPADRPSDVYSLGVVAYELLAGVPPFADDEVQAILVAHLSRAPEPLSRLVPGLPERASRAVLDALAKRPEARPGVGELARELALAAREIRTTTVTSDGWSPVVAERRRERLHRERTGALAAEPIGREAELGQLVEALDLAASCGGRLVTIAGEPGTGKSTLVASFLARARVAFPHAWVAVGRTAEHFASAEPCSPVLDALSELLRGPRGAELGAALRAVAPTWAAHFPELRDAEGRDDENDGPRSRDRMPRELSALVETLGAAQPVVLALEDLHWSDPATVDLLSFLASRLDLLPLLVVGTYRPTDVEIERHPLRALLQVLGQGNHSWVEISPAPFGRGDAEALLARELGAAPPPELVELALRRTEGNPLFLVNLLAHLRSSGALVRRDGKLVLLRSVDSLEQSLPEGIAAVIQQKLERLETIDRRLLDAASVVGDSFDAALVAHLVEREEVEVEEALAALESRHRLLAPTGEIQLPDGSASASYRFAHALFRHAFYDELPPRRRELWHRLAAEELERRHGAERGSVLAQLAVHWERGRDPRRAIERNLEAADVAARRNPKHARPALETALDLAGRLPEAEARAVRARLLVRLGRHDAETAEFVGDVSLYERAEAAISEALALEPGSLEARTTLGIVHLERGENERAFVDFARVLELDAAHAPAWDGLSYLFKNTGSWDRALAAHERAAEGDAGYAHSIRRLSVLIYLDRFSDAIAEADALVARRPRFAHHAYWRGIASFYAGDRDEGRRWIERGYELDPDDPIASGVLAFALAADGDRGKARELLASAEPGAAADGTFTYWIAKTHALLEEPARAVDWLGRAIRLGYWDTPWMRKDFAVRSLDGSPGFAERLGEADARRAALERRIHAESTPELAAALAP